METYYAKIEVKIEAENWREAVKIAQSKGLLMAINVCKPKEEGTEFEI